MTLPRGRGRPRREGGPDPVRSFRMGAIFDRAREKAERGGETIVQVIERLLRRYLDEDEPEQKPKG